MEKINVKFNNRIIYAEKGDNLLSVLRNGGITIPSDCGGKKKCLKCKVKISPFIESPCKKYLSSGEYNSNVRLACFFVVNEDIEVTSIEKAQADVLSVNQEFLSGQTSVLEAENLKKLACVDIGTTTVTISICDENFKHIETVNFLNPQRTFGADVVARIKASDEGHLESEQKLICDAVYEVFEKFNVTKAVISANNVMLHLLLGVSPHSIGVSPYKPQFCDLKNLSFSEVFQKGEGEVILLPSISGYVGGDIIAGMISTDIENKSNTLFLDLGTNGEMVLNAGGKLFCTSTAAGPAFEGGNISCGSYARSGAIAKVEFSNGKIKVDDELADGICGSGLIDLIAVLLQNDVIDEMGGYNESNLVVTVDGQKRVYLNENVYLSQKDIRAVQLAKGAISCGIKSLLNFAKLKESDLNKIMIGGGFSKNLNFSSCERIGLIPKELGKICTASGNTAILGALMCLKEQTLLEKAKMLAEKTQVLELGSDENFFNNFTECLIFE